MNGGPARPGCDDDALGAFLEEHIERLEGYVAKRVRGDVHAIEDLVQLTLMQLIAYSDQKGGLPPCDEAVRLLYKIAWRRICDWYSRTGKAELCPSDSTLLTEAVSACEALDSVVPTRLDVKRALTRLTPPQQQSLVLVYVDGMSYRDAAKVMGIGENGLKKHLQNAKARARQLEELAGYGRAQAGAEGPHHD